MHDVEREMVAEYDTGDYGRRKLISYLDGTSIRMSGLKYQKNEKHKKTRNKIVHYNNRKTIPPTKCLNFYV